jgi:hypothetical protein
MHTLQKLYAFFGLVMWIKISFFLKKKEYNILCSLEFSKGHVICYVMGHISQGLVVQIRFKVTLSWKLVSKLFIYVPKSSV